MAAIVPAHTQGRTRSALEVPGVVAAVFASCETVEPVEPAEPVESVVVVMPSTLAEPGSARMRYRRFILFDALKLLLGKLHPLAQSEARDNINAAPEGEFPVQINASPIRSALLLGDFGDDWHE